MTDLTKKSRTELEEYIKELETELGKIQSAPLSVNPMYPEEARIKESRAIDKPILIVEDYEGFSRLIERDLNEAGWQVACAPTGGQAIEMINENPDFLLLLDYGLPDITGTQLIQKLENNGQITPFIMMTGSGDEKIATETMKRGARDYLIKDSNILETLPEVIRRVNRELHTETRLAQIEEELRETRQRLHSVINATPIILWSIDKDGIISL